MRRCHGNRGVLFQKCQIVLLSSHFSDNLVSLSPSSLTHTTIPGILFLLPLSLSLPSIQPPTPRLFPGPQPSSGPRRKWPDRLISSPASHQARHPLPCFWRRGLPALGKVSPPPLIFGRHAPPSRGLLECSGVILFC